MAAAGGEALRFDEIHSTLRDGTAVVLRPIQPNDKHRLAEGLSRLSASSRALRFMAPIAELTDDQLAYLTEIDYVDHFAWVALLEVRPDYGIGVARYVRLADDAQIAEAAVTVADEYQGRGLGTLLVGVLAATARMAGIERFRAYVLEANEPMLALLGDLGVEVSHDSPGVLRADIPLVQDLVADSPMARALERATEDVGRAAVPRQQTR